MLQKQTELVKAAARQLSTELGHQAGRERPPVASSIENA
jgi:hypothetical protein